MNVSIIIPTLNEAAQIVAALQAVRAVAPHAEIIVADGGSSDGTAELATVYTRVVAAPRGRARQMNAGAAHATGDVLLFLHADTRLPHSALAAAADALRDERVVGGGFALRFDERSLIYWAIAEGTNVRSVLRGVFTGDQCFFVRASVFRALGGYADIPLMEDLEFGRRLRGVGAVRLLRPPVLVSARRHRKHGPLRVLVSGWGLRILHVLGMPEWALHRLYYGRMPE